MTEIIGVDYFQITKFSLPDPVFKEPGVGIQGYVAHQQHWCLKVVKLGDRRCFGKLIVISENRLHM